MGCIYTGSLVYTGLPVEVCWNASKSMVAVATAP